MYGEQYCTYPHVVLGMPALSPREAAPRRLDNTTTLRTSHRKMAKDPKRDGALTDTLDEKVHDRAAGDSSSVMDTLKGGVETVRGAFSAVTGGVGKAWFTVGEWKNGGVCVE